MNINDKVFLATCGTEEIKLTCPCCFGKLKVRVILGNDEIVEVPCEACSLGYEGPRGYIREHKWIAKVEESYISEFRSKNSTGGQIIESIFCGGGDTKRYFSDTENIFDNREDAEKRCLELIDEHENKIEQGLKWSKERANKSYAWHVRYHLKEVRDAERRLKWHSERAVYCKKLAKTEVKEDELTKKYLKVEDII